MESHESELRRVSDAEDAESVNCGGGLYSDAGSGSVAGVGARQQQGSDASSDDAARPKFVDCLDEIVLDGMKAVSLDDGLVTQAQAQGQQPQQQQPSHRDLLEQNRAHYDVFADPVPLDRLDEVIEAVGANTADAEAKRTYGRGMLDRRVSTAALAEAEHRACVLPSNDILVHIFSSARRVAVEQRLDELDQLAGIEREGRYRIMFDNGLRATSAERSRSLYRAILGRQRPWTMRIQLRDTEEPFLILHKPFSLRRRCCFVYRSTEDGSQGELLGTVQHKFALTQRRFFVCDASGKRIFVVQAHRASRSFIIYEGDECGPEGQAPRELGRIKKRYSGLLREIYADADTFAMRFPHGSTPVDKALLFSATFYLDSLHFSDTTSSWVGTTFF